MKLINFDYIPSNYKEEVIINLNNIIENLLIKNKNYII